MSNRRERRQAERDAKKIDKNKKSYEMPMLLLQPWSVPVLQSKLPQEVLDVMIKISDDIINDKESISHGEYLAGQVDTELRVPHELLHDAKIMEFFNGFCEHFIRTVKCQQYPYDVGRVQAEKLFVQMLTMWIVSQQPNEYNPIHIHTECQLSCVMYLKVPKFEPPRKAHRNSDDGSITFISNSPKDSEFGASPITIRPSVGDIFIFSAAQQHGVYPYRCTEGDPERRSISFNAIFETETDRKVNQTRKTRRGTIAEKAKLYDLKEL